MLNDTHVLSGTTWELVIGWNTLLLEIVVCLIQKTRSWTKILLLSINSGGIPSHADDSNVQVPKQSRHHLIVFIDNTQSPSKVGIYLSRKRILHIHFVYSRKDVNSTDYTVVITLAFLYQLSSGFSPLRTWVFSTNAHLFKKSSCVMTRVSLPVMAR